MLYFTFNGSIIERTLRYVRRRQRVYMCALGVCVLTIFLSTSRTRSGAQVRQVGHRVYLVGGAVQCAAHSDCVAAAAAAGRLARALRPVRLPGGVAVRGDELRLHDVPAVRAVCRAAGGAGVHVHAHRGGGVGQAGARRGGELARPPLGEVKAKGERTRVCCLCACIV